MIPFFKQMMQIAEGIENVRKKKLIREETNMAQIIDFDGVTKLDIDPDKILEGAKGELEVALVFGYDKEDGLYVASSTSQIGEILLILERAKQFLLEQ